MITREGVIPITVSGVAAIAVACGFGLPWSMPLWVIFCFCVLVFYAPVRVVPAVPLAVVSPVDGVVVDIRNIDDLNLGRETLSIEIRIQGSGIFPLRSPMEGKIMNLWTSAGDCADPYGPSGATGGNQVCYSMWIQSDECDDVVWILSTNRFFSRFRSDVAPGERIGQGKRTGFVIFGRRIQVRLPVTSRCSVSIGERVLAGSGVLGTLVHV
jgi:phosphatidylserine decarboxylase